MTKRGWIHIGLVLLALALAKFASGQVVSSGNPALVNQPVILTAGVQVPTGVTAVPTGTMTFQDGTSVLGTVGLVGGVAQLSTRFSVLGNHSITASYSGDANFAPAVSAAFIEQVTGGDGFTMSVTPATITQAAGGSSSQQITLFSDGSSLTKAVTLDCEQLPAGVSCNFSQQGIVPTVAGVPITVEVKSSAAHSVSAALFGPNRNARLGAMLFWLCLSVTGVMVTLPRGSRLPLCVAVVLGLALTGCGDTIKRLAGPTPSGTYSFQVTATDGATTRAQTVQLVVQ